MIYLTGDTHGRFDRIEEFCRKTGTTTYDVLIILGDAGLNYWLGYRDEAAKEYVSELPVTLFCVHGNHERRPATIPSYKEKQYRGGTVWYEDAYPNILFAKDGEIYDFDGKSCIVIGGAYSVDKSYRLMRGWNWFPDEQPSQEIKARVWDRLESINYTVDVVLSHTCPLRYEPTEVFIPGVDQSAVDKSTEEWLGKLEERIDYKAWYCGHYHTTKRVDNIRFMFEDYAVLE